MDENVLTVEKRTVFGRAVKHLRAEGLVPGIVYGSKKEPVPFQTPAVSLEKLLSRVQNQLFDLVIGNEPPRKVLVQEVQRHPVRRFLLHVDLQQVDLTEKREAEVPLVIVGSSALAESNQYYLNHQLTEVVVRCLPVDIPNEIEVDISLLETPEATIVVGDLPIPENVELITAKNELVASLSVVRAAEEETAEGAEEEAAETVEAGEVEVIKKGKTEEEEE